MLIMLMVPMVNPRMGSCRKRSFHSLDLLVEDPILAVNLSIFLFLKHMFFLRFNKILTCLLSRIGNSEPYFFPSCFLVFLFNDSNKSYRSFICC